MEGKETLNIKDLCQSMNVPVVAGNCVTYKVAKLLMDAGVAGLMGWDRARSGMYFKGCFRDWNPSSNCNR